jgi:hypothetical protein
MPQQLKNRIEPAINVLEKNKHLIKAEKIGVKRQYYVSNEKVARLVNAMTKIFNG